jgi:NAD(P)-dependent dehydrogenase (short-subunit alcohol dehydrogenase family)
MSKWTDKTVVVTGGASGIGLSIAQVFAGAGAQIVIADLDQGRIDDALELLRDSQARAMGIETDVSDFTSVSALAERTVAEWGVPDVVVNNAGVDEISTEPVWNTSIETWRWIYGVNVFGVVHGIAAFVPLMLKEGRPAHFVTTASDLGLMSDTDSAVYASSKHAVIRIMEGLHLQLRAIEAPVSATVLCPGLTSTNLLQSETYRPPRWLEGTGERSEAIAAAALEEFGQFPAVDEATPESVAERLMAALEDQSFYCITAPGVDTAVEARFENILSRRNPELYPIGVYCGLCTRIRPEDCATCRPSGQPAASASG